MKIKLLVHSIFGGISFLGIGVLIYLAVDQQRPSLFISTTYVGYFLATFYFLAHSYCDYKEINSPFTEWLRNVYYKYGFIWALIVFWGYWLLAYLGPDFMYFSLISWELLGNFFIHLILPWFMAMDIFFTERKLHVNYFLDCIILGIWLTYSVILLLLAKFADVPVYPFLEHLSIKDSIFLNVMLTFIGFNIYLLYHYWLKKQISKFEKRRNLDLGLPLNENETPLQNREDTAL